MIGPKKYIKDEGTLMKKLLVLLLLFLIIIAAIGAYYFLIPWLSSQPLRQVEKKKTVNIPEGEKVKRTLYFYFEDRLAAEERDLPLKREDLMAQARDVIKELIKGPVTDLRLTPVLPEEIKVRGVFLDSDGICYIDFGREIQERFPGGVWTEVLSLYSIVNTLTTNFPEIKGVKILVEGYGVETLAGHIDIRYPLQRREDLISQ